MTALLWLSLALTADLDAIKAEPDLGKRAAKAMDYATAQLTEARRAGLAGEGDRMKEALTGLVQGAELALATVKSIRKPAMAAKRVELRSRELLRRLDTLLQDLPVEERESALPFQVRLQAVHEELLELSLGRS